LQIDPPNFDITSVGTSATVDYLQDNLLDILSTVEELYYPIQQGELPYLLRLPFVDKEFYLSTPYNDFFGLIDSFFNLEDKNEMFGLTSRVQQSFYDTILINPLYIPYIFKVNFGVDSPKIPIIIDITIDQKSLNQSIYQTQSDLEFDIKLKVIDFLSQKEGFQIDFFESELENLVINSFNSDLELIKNFNLKSPQQFIINNSDEIYYQIGKNLTITELVNFIPPYFYYDYDNITLNTKIY